MWAVFRRRHLECGDTSPLLDETTRRRVQKRAPIPPHQQLRDARPKPRAPFSSLLCYPASPPTFSWDFPSCLNVLRKKNAPLYYYLLTTGIILRSVGLRWRMKAPESPSSLKWRPTIWPRGSASSRRAFARCDCKSGTTPAPCGSGYHPSDRVKPSQGHSGLIG